MTTSAIVESGMTFGPYAPGHCFYIEKSQCYEAIQQDVQMAEFLLLKQQQNGQAVWVIEAKSSTPRPATQPKFSDFIDEIRSKLTNAFLLALAAHLKRHPAAEAELPAPFAAIPLQTLTFRFVLVVNGHQAAWLPPLNAALASALKPVLKTWGLPAASVAVLNHEGAEKQGLILPTRPLVN